jgi:hypothetical protein
VNNLHKVGWLTASMLLAIGCNREPDPAGELEQSAEVPPSAIIATIELDHAAVLFVQSKSGEVTILKEFDIGADAPQLEGEEDMTFAEIYEAYAPGKPVPQCILDAMEKAQRVESDIGIGVEMESSAGAELDPLPSASDEDVAVASSALTTSVIWSDFYAKYCAGGTVGVQCYRSIYAGESLSKKAHRSGAVVCGNYNAVEWSVWISGKKRYAYTASYGKCYRFEHHHSHDFWGTPETATIRYTMDSTPSGPAVVGAWWENFGSDEFYVLPPGWPR